MWAAGEAMRGHAGGGPLRRCRWFSACLPPYCLLLQLLRPVLQCAAAALLGRVLLGAVTLQARAPAPCHGSGRRNREAPTAMLRTQHVACHHKRFSATACCEHVLRRACP